MSNFVAKFLLSVAVYVLTTSPLLAEASLNELISAAKKKAPSAISDLRSYAGQNNSRLFREVKSQDEKSVYLAASAFGYLRDDQAADTLIELLSNSSKKVRGAASWSLERLSPQIDAKLLPLLQSPREEIRDRAVFALGKKRAVNAIDPLVELLRKEPDPGMRNSIAWALGAIGNSDAEVPLVASLDDKDQSVRYQAAIALGKIGTTRALSALKHLSSHDPAPKVRKEAQLAAKRVASRNKPPTTTKNNILR